MGTYRYNANGRTSVRPHAVTRVGTQTYRYDANGNLRRGGGWSIIWDYENRPVRMVQAGETTTFVYDGDGSRVKKTVTARDGSPRTTVSIGQLYVGDPAAFEDLHPLSKSRKTSSRTTGLPRPCIARRNGPCHAR